MQVVAELEGSDKDADLLAFSWESSSNYPSQDDWHVSLKIADTYVNFKLEAGADCNVISQSLFDRLPVQNTWSHQCKAKQKVYKRHRINPKGKVSLACENKGKFTVTE